eukprot:CAMPEP_0195535432 /NCGR_PEP_ID=MMETSP0794_2-20130614/44255_1 /TAXON_ID=515487 /ORGANISM="Stephanopyxis turris, Strain CCMP 815" /LENGTH=612 /DNA_ID=CAMNT_0040668571 /DNA_START=35 /DNA_END=1871 /DNA_ORIENTATION=+
MTNTPDGVIRYGAVNQSQIDDDDEYDEDEYDDDDDDDSVEVPLNDVSEGTALILRNGQPKSTFCEKLCVPDSCLHQSITTILVPFKIIGTAIQDTILILIRVDSVWDSPVITGEGVASDGSISISGGGTLSSFNSGNISTRRKLGVLVWLSVLVLAYTAERYTFKVLVDRVGPFRLFAGEVLTGFHAMVLGMIIFVPGLVRRMLNRNQNREESVGFHQWKLVNVPLADIGLMAILDSVHLLLALISGSHVSPFLTVMLVQLTIPLTICFTQCINKDGACGNICNAFASSEDDMVSLGPFENCDDMSRSVAASSTGMDDRSMHSNSQLALDLPNDNVNNFGGLSTQHLLGASIILFALLLILSPSILELIKPANLKAVLEHDFPSTNCETAWNTIVFALSFLPHATSTLFKEYTQIECKQPVDSNSLNMILSIFQFVFMGILSPLFYALQGLAAPPSAKVLDATKIGRYSWIQNYPTSDVSVNFKDGLKCFCGILDTTIAQERYAEPAQCDWAWLLVLVHILSIIAIGLAIDRMVLYGATKILYRGLSVGLVCAVILMVIYDKQAESSVVKCMYFGSMAILLIGLETFHKVRLPNATFETVYPEMENLYEDDK